jgi:hypothetical protein
VETLDFIHFRFNLLSAGRDTPNPFVHVPFELLYDSNKKNFIRALAPVARRVCLSEESHTGTVLPNTKSLNGHVSTVLQQRLAATPSAVTPAVQIIHYAGHSTNADDGTTYLILPGNVEGQLTPLRMSDFATWARTAGVQLVILSSCESSAPEAVFRLSQVGIPAVIGFRWEINDKEAAFFTGRVHDALARGVPLARAFHFGVSAVAKNEGSPTFASPMLVVQDEEWTI